MAAAGAWMRLAARAVQGNRHIALAAGASAVLASSMATQTSAAKSNPAAAAGKAAVPSSPLERAKRAAARGAVDEYVKSGMVVGVGSGSTIVYGIQRLAELYHLQGVDMVCVPTSFQSRQVRAQFPRRHACSHLALFCRPHAVARRRLSSSSKLACPSVT